jgi:hypothetical protein
MLIVDALTAREDGKRIDCREAPTATESAIHLHSSHNERGTAAAVGRP